MTCLCMIQKPFVSLTYICLLQNIHIITVGIGGGVSEEELRGMASYPTDKNVIQVNNFDALTNILDTLSKGLCDSKFTI